MANLYSAATYFKIAQVHFTLTVTQKSYALSEKMSSVAFKAATDVDDFNVCGRLFHACGPAKAKPRLPNSVRDFGTTRLPVDEERSHCLVATTITGIHSSARYDSARLRRALYTVRHSLIVMLCGTRSQWRYV